MTNPINLHLVKPELTGIYFTLGDGGYKPVNRVFLWLEKAYGLSWDYFTLGYTYNPKDEYHVRKVHEWADKLLIPREVLDKLVLAGNIPVDIHNDPTDKRIRNKKTLEDYYLKMTQ